MAYNTGNPPGSSSPKDLIDNAEDLDYLMTGSGASHPNRLGVPLKSWKGMEGEHDADQIRREAEFDADQVRRESEFDADQSRHESEHDADQARRESEFDVDQDNREGQFNAFMASSGLEPPVAYASGVVLTRTTQTVTYLGNEYRAKVAFLPLTLSNWAADSAKLLLVGDDALRQDIAKSSAVSVYQHGAALSNTGEQNRIAFQAAVNEAAATGKNVLIPGDLSTWMVDGTVWCPSGTTIMGHGGRNKKTKIKAVNGHFTDVFVSGVHTEGVNHSVDDWVMLARNGYPYSKDNLGSNITLVGIYIDGNGANAGYPPELGPGTDYRGCNIRIRYVDGVNLYDVFSEYAPNDCAHVARCRRIAVAESEFSRNFLIGNVIGGTRNGLTVAGTLSGHGFPTADFLSLTNITVEETEDLGVAVQFASDPDYPTSKSGAVNINGIFTRRNATYGLAVEVFGSGTNQPDRENININNVISIEDSRRTDQAYAGILISNKSRAVNLSNYVVRDSGGHGLVFAGAKTINLSNGLIEGYNLGGFPNVKGIFGYAVGAEVPELCNMTNQIVLGGAGRGGDTYGLNITGYKKIKAVNLEVNGTSYSSIVDSAGIYLGADDVQVINGSVENSATNGWRITGFKDFSLLACVAKNSGKAGGAAQKIGFNIAPGTNRKGKLIGCNSYDDQAVPTQSYGYLLGSSATDRIEIFSSGATGNTLGPISNTGMPNARVHGNGFDYTGSTLPFKFGGSGSFLGGRQTANNWEWFDTYSVPRVKKDTAPTSQMDGFPLAVQVSVPGTSTSSGARGYYAVDDTFVYHYTGDGATHKWRRTAAAAW